MRPDASKCGWVCGNATRLRGKGPIMDSAHPDYRSSAPDRLIIAALASDDWTPAWKAIERLLPATVTSSKRLTILYELLRDWEMEGAERTDKAP